MTRHCSRPIEHHGCPCCGQPVEPCQLLVDLNTNSATYQGRSWKVTPKLAEFMYAVSRVSPRAARDSELSTAMWGSAEEHRVNALSQYAHFATAMLSPLGLEIRRVNGVGYKLRPSTGEPVGLRLVKKHQQI